MQYSAELVTMHLHEANVLRAEREIGLRRSVDDQAGADDAAPAPATARRHRRAHRLPRLALR
ncbi:hypothetical protein ABIQ69_16585 [Agromyces sp. G08B096]|uniref:Uncharacterized protein n=1 Tax=Agromyces sp. G08B096 TaxID=3156399 RepID=A0AAU7W796_9MICO